MSSSIVVMGPTSDQEIRLGWEIGQETAAAAAEVVLRVFNLVDEHRLEEMSELLTFDVDFINPFGHVTGRDAVFANFVPVKVGFPDSCHIIPNVYSTGDAVAVEGERIDTNSGPIVTPQGEITTGRTVRFPFGGNCRVRDGRLESVHIYYDLVIIYRQLDLM